MNAKRVNEWVRSVFFENLHAEAKLLQAGIKKRPSFVFLVVGIASLIWLVVRSGRKPDRLAYPCQRAAATNTAVFLGWIGSVLLATVISQRLSRTGRLVFRWALGVGLVLITLGGLRAFYVSQWQAQFVSQAIGQGVSRVVWVQDQRAALGWSSDMSQRVDVAVVEEMVDTAIRKLTGQADLAAAWSQIFQDHNGGSDYQPGEIIAIKINFNNAESIMDHNPSYQMVNALLRQLIDEAGIAPQNIILYDATRDFQTPYIQGVAARFPEVQINPDRDGCFDAAVWTSQLTCVLRDADYLINMPLLRTHGQARVTLSFKNHLGSTRQPWNFHDRFVMADPAQNSIVVLNNHPYIRDKTILILAEAIYGLRVGGPYGNPASNYGIIDPFPNSVFASTDPVAIDSVMVDYLQNRNALFDPTEARLYLAAAASIGLGNYESDLDYRYDIIDLLSCTDGRCSDIATDPIPSGCMPAHDTANSVVCSF